MDTIRKTTATMSQEIETNCVEEAFKEGNKQDAERLLLQIKEPADITTTTSSISDVWNASQVSLLHLAAQNGWMDIIIDLITKYKCDTNCKDSNERTPLHYAVSNDQLEVVRYLINEQHCDLTTRDIRTTTISIPGVMNASQVSLLHLAAHHGWMDIIRESR